MFLYLQVKIGALDLPVLYGDKVHCLDVLFALVKRILGEVEISEEMRLEAEERLLKSFPNRKTLKAETTTLVLRQQIRAAKVIQVRFVLLITHLPPRGIFSRASFPLLNIKHINLLSVRLLFLNFCRKIFDKRRGFLMVWV